MPKSSLLQFEGVRPLEDLSTAPSLLEGLQVSASLEEGHIALYLAVMLTRGNTLALFREGNRWRSLWGSESYRRPPVMPPGGHGFLAFRGLGEMLKERLGLAPWPKDPPRFFAWVRSPKHPSLGHLLALVAGWEMPPDTRITHPGLRWSRLETLDTIEASQWHGFSSWTSQLFSLWRR